MKRLLRSFALIAALLPTLALAQSAPANLPYHTVFGRMGATPGDTGPGSAIPFATLGAQLGTAGIPTVSIESKAGGCNIADNTAALLAAANSVSGPVRITFPNNCTYRFTQANAIVFAKQVFLQGGAPTATVLAYNPTADGTFLSWAAGLNVLYAGGGAGADNLTITSSDTTHTKVLVSMTDVSGFRLTNTSIGWPYGLITGGGGSVCLQTRGRETSTFDYLTLSCDRPLQISMNPNAAGSADHFHFSNLYLLSGNGFPDITADPGVVFSNTTFDGFQAWVLGQDGFHYVDTAAAHQVIGITSAGTGYVPGQIVSLVGGTCSSPIKVRILAVTGSGGIAPAGVSIAEPGVCSVTPSMPASLATGGASVTAQLVSGLRLAFANVRAEQGSGGASTYTFNIQTAGGLQGLTISNSIMDSARCGFIFKNTWFATIRESTWLSDGGLTCAGSATAANNNDALSYISNFWLGGAVHNVAGLTAASSVGGSTGTSVSMPASAFYTKQPLTTGLYNLAVTNNVQAVSYNNMGVTNPASTANLVPGAGKTFAFNNTMTLNATDGATVNFGAGGTILYTGSGSALTKTDDTNVTATLGGSPATALVNAASVTLGWTGTLSAARGGFGSDVSAASGVPFFTAGVPTFTATSGTGNFARVTSPAFVTPILGVASSTSQAITGAGGAGFVELANQSSAPSTPTSASRLYADASNRLAWKGTNGFVRTFDGTANTADRIYVLPDAAGTVALTANNLSVFASTTSAQLAGVLSDETGTGAAVFANSPTLVTPALGTPASGVATNMTGTAPGLTAGNATNATLATNSTNIAITDDSATNATMYPLWVTGTSGNLPAKISSTKINFNPSSGILTAINFAGGGSLLSGIPLSGLSGLGTGVATALGVNVGSAGAFVTAGGALGTPSSGTLTNATGLPTTALTGALQAAQEPAHIGDVTNSAGSLVLAIGTTKVTSAMLNADVFSTAHSWGGVQTLTNPVVGTQAANDNSTKAASTAYADAIAALKANLASPTFTGTPAAPTAAVDTNTTQIATTAMVLAQAASATPANDAYAGVVGTSTRYARGDHVHAISLTNASNALGANVLLNNTANFFDGPSMAQGTSGTWFASGTVTLTDSVGAASVFCKLWDGTTVISAATPVVPGAGGVAVQTLSGILASPAANIRISCRDLSSTSGSILFNNTGTSKDATVYGFRIN